MRPAPPAQALGTKPYPAGPLEEPGPGPNK